MYKDYRYINAGSNEIYRYGRKAIEKVEACKAEHNGYVSIPVDGGKYWTIGTSDGKYGEYCKFGDTFFSVNNGGYAYAKVGTEKADILLKALDAMIAEMQTRNESRAADADLEIDE